MLRRAFVLLRQRSRRRRYLHIQDLLCVRFRAGFILDLGGGPASFFAAMYPRPEQVILLDIDHKRARQAKQKQFALCVMVADGERLPLADCAVEATVCNSVIEHVPNPDVLAAEIRRVSWSYFLQTPNGDFPLETHSFIAIPFYNLIPWGGVQRLICRAFGANFERISGVRYLPEQRLRALFPEAAIAYERALGLIKSFYIYYSKSL